jgi:hypothetical protein
MASFPSTNEARNAAILAAFQMARDTDGILNMPSVALYLPNELTDFDADEFADALALFTGSAVSAADVVDGQPPPSPRPPLDIDDVLAQIKAFENEAIEHRERVFALRAEVFRSRERLARAITAYALGGRRTVTPEQNARNEALAAAEYKQGVLEGRYAPPKTRGVGPSRVDQLAASGDQQGWFRRGAVAKQNLLERRKGSGFPNASELAQRVGAPFKPPVTR